MFRNAWWSNAEKAILLRTWDDSGKRITEKVPFSPYLYTESAYGNYTSILGTKLAIKEFKTPFDRTLFLKRVGEIPIYENFETAHQFLLDKFWRQSISNDFEKRDLRILFYDIEVDPLPTREFPSPSEAKAEINLITFYDSLEKKYFIFSKNEYTGNNLGDDTYFIKCADEAELLRRIVRFWQHNEYPDIASAWNSNNFDFPYIRNRILNVVGEEYYKMLSPYGVIKEIASTDKMQHEYTRYDIAGVSNLDYIDVYIKFKGERQESYRLDYIGNLELGLGKIENNETSFSEFIKADWNKFVEYNKRDVEILVKLEEKLRYFKILQTLAYMSCVNFEKAMMPIFVTNGSLAVQARQDGRKLHSFKRSISNAKLSGGYVTSVSGFHKDIVTLDATSMYPSIIISNNISPETKIGIATPKSFGVSVLNGSSNDMFKFVLANKKEYEITRTQLTNMLKKKNFTICANGTVFSQKRQGLLPRWIEEVFNKRVEKKERIKELQCENQLLMEQLEKISQPS